MHIGIVVATENESHQKILKNIARIINAKICRSYFCYTDILVGIDSTLQYLPYYVGAKLKNITTIAFMHDIRSISHTYLAALDAERNPLEQRLRRMFSLSLVKPLLDGVLSPTRAIAATIREYTGVEPCVVYLGVDHAIYRPTQIKKVRRFKAILVVATKPHITKTAIAVFRKLKTRAKLFVRGPCPADLKDVVCIPKLPEEALPRLYASADVLFYPSLHEGFGLVPLEAAACGLPVIALNEPAVAEVLGDAGLFVKPTSITEAAEVVDWALNNEELLKELSVRGLRRAREFSWERTAKMLYTCIEKFVRL